MPPRDANLGLAEQIARRDRKAADARRRARAARRRKVRQEAARRAQADRAKGTERSYVPPKLTPAERQRFERLQREGQKGNEREREKHRTKTIAESRPSGLGLRIPGARTVLGDVKEIGYGIADAAADYGTAAVKDIARTGGRSDRTARLAARDALGLLAAAETAIPEPKWVPEWMRKEVVEVDPENLSVRRGSGRVDREDTKRAGRFWRENPLIGALLVTPAGSAAARRASRGAIQASIRRANPDLPKRDASRLARKESNLPGYAAAHGVKGGIPERSIRGEFGEARGRPYSRTPVGRAGQRGFDRASQLIEATRGPGAKFSSSQRAARMKERELRKGTARTQAEVTRLERIVRKGVGRLGRSPVGREALIATLEAPRGLTPRQAVEVKLADLRSTIERPRSSDEAQARVAALDRELERGLRPLVDQQFPAAARRREQAMRNVLPYTRGKRAAAGLEREIEMSGVEGRSSSVLANAYEQVEARIVELASEPDADPVVKKVAALIAERDAARDAVNDPDDAVNDPDVVFGDKAGDYGLTGASPAASKRLARQVKALERALEKGIVDSDEFASAVGAAETLSRQADESAKTVLGMSDEDLAARRNVVARRYAERGLLPEGVEPDARGFFPHRDEFETVGGSMGAPTLAATGGVVGRPMPGRAFERRQNELKLYEQGRVQTNPRVLSNTVRQRERFLTTLEARGALYEHGRPIVSGEPVPEGAMLVRNPEQAPKQIPPNVRAAIENPERFAELTERAGAFPEPETFAQWVDSWLYRGHGPEPEWLADLENVRAVPEGVVKTMLADVFRSAPRGSIAAIFGTLNSLARAVTIYTPYGGTRYVAKNTPQNMILLAMTQPKAFLKLRQSVVTLRGKEPDMYAAIKAEAGTIPAAAGLPELAGRRQTKAQRVEGGMTDASRKIAGGLGEITDEPWRVASWLGYADKYDFKTPAKRRELLTSDDPAIVRVRDDIAQRVRDDMIDFDALTPFERESLSRFLFIYPFVRGALKWPFMYLREYPVRSAVMSLIAVQHAREETPGRKTSVLEAGRTEIGGREVDLGWLNPAAPAAGTIEDLSAVAEGIGSKRIDVSALRGLLAPQYRSSVDALGFGASTESLGRAFLPGYSTGEKIAKGGGVGEQVLRGLGSTIDYVEPVHADARAKVRKERTAVLRALNGKVDADDFKWIKRAYGIKEQMDVLRATATDETESGEPYFRRVLADEARLLGKLGIAGKEDVAWLVKIAETGSYEDVKSRRAKLVASVYESEWLKPIRAAKETAGIP